MNTIKKILSKIVTLFHIKTQKNLNIKNLLKNEAVICEASSIENLIINSSIKYSMNSKIRMWALIQSLKHIINKRIDGDFVETGVYKGGNLILMRKILDLYEPNSSKKIFGFDTFEGMIEPGQNDYDIFGGDNPHNFWKQNQKKSYNNWCYSPNG